MPAADKSHERKVLGRVSRPSGRTFTAGDILGEGWGTGWVMRVGPPPIPAGEANGNRERCGAGMEGAPADYSPTALPSNASYRRRRMFGNASHPVPWEQLRRHQLRATAILLAR